MIGLLALSIAAGSAETACIRLDKPLAAGAAITPDAATPIMCAKESAVPAGYDYRHGVVRTTRSLPAGALVLRPPAHLMADVNSGDALALTVRVGSVEVRRAATALTPGVLGKSLAVRTVEGATVTGILAQDR